jgi:hypothetical protein
LLPTKLLDVNKPGNKYGMKIGKEGVTLLFCANKTEVPVCWKSPQYFYHINMAYLPVIWKSIKNTSKTRDIFVSWFNEGFVPTIENYLHS